MSTEEKTEHIALTRVLNRSTPEYSFCEVPVEETGGRGADYILDVGGWKYLMIYRHLSRRWVPVHYQVSWGGAVPEVNLGLHATPRLSVHARACALVRISKAEILRGVREQVLPLD